MTKANVKRHGSNFSYRQRVNWKPLSLLLLAACGTSTTIGRVDTSTPKPLDACTESHRCASPITNTLVGPFAIDNGTIYFVGPTSIVKVSQDGQRLSLLNTKAINGANILNLSIANNSVYWNTDAQVYRVATNGGEAQLVGSGHSIRASVAMSGGTVFIDYHEDGREQDQGPFHLQYASTNGQMNEVATERYITQIASNKDTLVWLAEGGLRWCKLGCEQIRTIRLSFSTLEVSAVGIDAHRAFIVHRSRTDPMLLSIVRVDLQTAIITELLTVRLALELQAISLAVDPRYVYWTNSALHTVEKMPINGGSPEVIATAKSPFAVKVDDGFACYADLSTTSLIKLTPK